MTSRLCLVRLERKVHCISVTLRPGPGFPFWWPETGNLLDALLSAMQRALVVFDLIVPFGHDVVPVGGPSHQPFPSGHNSSYLEAQALARVECGR